MSMYATESWVITVPDNLYMYNALIKALSDDTLLLENYW